MERTFSLVAVSPVAFQYMDTVYTNSVVFKPIEKPCRFSSFATVSYTHLPVIGVRKDPYQLADDIHGVGFKIADEIAAKVGICLLYTSPQCVKL